MVDDDPTPEVLNGYAEAVSDVLGVLFIKGSRLQLFARALDTRKEDRQHLFSKQAIPIVWDYAELNPFADMRELLHASITIVADAIAGCASQGSIGQAFQADVLEVAQSCTAHFVSTDPPYYDNIGYADLSDFFYVWLRSLKSQSFPRSACHARDSKIFRARGHAVSSRQQGEG